MSPRKENILRSYDFSNINKSCPLWSRNLRKVSIDTIKARDLYQGVSWSTTLDVEESFSKTMDTTLLIASAGHGLINANDKISPYACTFSKGHKDSVYNFINVRNVTKFWWKKTNKMTISKFEQDAYFFIFVSSEYIIAMENFIEELISIYGEKVFVLSSSQTKFSKNIEKNIIKFDTKFNSFEAGTLTTLSQRCMRWLSNEINAGKVSLELSSMKEHVETFLSTLKPYKIKVGKQLNDKELIKMIKKQIKNKQIGSATQGLKDLRSNGFACEQTRYGKFFKKIKVELD
ncbi:MAG: hypothetical protein ACWA5P_03285 [bacterium]